MLMTVRQKTLGDPQRLPPQLQVGQELLSWPRQKHSEAEILAELNAKKENLEMQAQIAASNAKVKVLEEHEDSLQMGPKTLKDGMNLYHEEFRRMRLLRSLEKFNLSSVENSPEENEMYHSPQLNPKLNQDVLPRSSH